MRSVSDPKRDEVIREMMKEKVSHPKIAIVLLELGFGRISRQRVDQITQRIKRNERKTS